MNSNIFLIESIFFTTILNTQTNRKVQALFLSNSYTYYNNLPQLIPNFKWQEKVLVK
jgi:hypothetical protein